MEIKTSPEAIEFLAKKLGDAHEEISRLRAALEKIRDTLETELNLDNYNHEEVIDLNSEATKAYHLAKQALAEGTEGK